MGNQTRLISLPGANGPGCPNVTGRDVGSSDALTPPQKRPQSDRLGWNRSLVFGRSILLEPFGTLDAPRSALLCHIRTSFGSHPIDRLLAKAFSCHTGSRTLTIPSAAAAPPRQSSGVVHVPWG
jgi:hypothetical protein